ncbi:MAG: cyclic-di-AMP receptor [Breznakia sp.]
MKLILAIVSNDDSHTVSNALTKENYQVTKLSTSGGFLRAGNTTLIVGVDDDKKEQVIEIIGRYSRKRSEVVPSSASYDIGRFATFPVEVQVGGATVFVIDVEQFVKL